MTRPTIKAVRILSIASLLGFVAGCCAEDSGTLQLQAQTTSVGQVGIELPPVAVRPQNGPLKVDVMFLLDDSFFNTKDTPEPNSDIVLGEIQTPGDGRIKSVVAQEVFRDAKDRLLNQLVSEGLGQTSDFDLAFGVSRFEDYANFVRSGPQAGDPTQVALPIDGLARPFILNQPILRQGNQLFASLFSLALSRTTPGDGGRDPVDAQSALEALYQLATGTGFDGDGNSSNLDSGSVGLETTQLAPGSSGDVPPFALGSQGTDDDGEPEWIVGDTRSSGSLGGAGWRPNSIRFIVVYSDIATITPLVEGTALDASVSNTPSAPGTGPRPSETITSVQAFAAASPVAPGGFPPGFASDATSQQAYARFGDETGAIPVAPTGAATLQATIEALNSMDIEVLAIGHREAVGSGPNKPNVPPPTLPGEEPAVPAPSEPPLNKAPFTWMSGVALLTGAIDTATSDPDTRWVPGLPLVYNLTTVDPPSAPVTDDLVHDLAGRIGAWLPYRSSGSSSGDPGGVYYLVTFDLANGNPDVVLSPDPGSALIPEGGTNATYLGTARDGTGQAIPGTQIVRVPAYFEGDTAPAPIRVAWQFATRRRVATSTAELLSVMPFTVAATLATDSTMFPPGTWPGRNPDSDFTVTGTVVPDTTGQITAHFPEVVLPNVPVPRASLTGLGAGREAFFRDVTRQLPTGVLLSTMAGPLDATDLPYPTVP